MKADKLLALKALGIPDDTIAALLDEVMQTEKSALALGVRYKEETLKPSEEADVIERAILGAGWTLDGQDTAPLWDLWERHGLAPALAFAVRCKASGQTPASYDPLVAAFQARDTTTDWRPR